MKGYWEKTLRSRMSRRRALVVGGAGALGAALLAACGGDDKGATETGAKSGLLTPPEDTSKQARKGGTFVYPTNREPGHFDGRAQGQIQLNTYNGLAYGGLVMNKPGYKQPSTMTEVLANLAESWEFSPDKTQITFKLRQGVKWHNKAPVNGRVFDSSDVVATWKRYISLPANNAVSNANALNPAAPIVSVEAPDARTVVYKLKEPASYLMQRLGNMITGELGTIQPREAGETFDPRGDQIGTGGFVLEKFEPSVTTIYKRNQDYWDKDAVNFDRLELPVMPEYATQLAQFRAGNLLHVPRVGGRPGIRAQDVLSLMKEVPGLRLYAALEVTSNPGRIFGFGWLPIEGQKSPFLDVRVRQALAMALDRDAYIDTFYEVSKFEAEGLPMETYYYVHSGYIPGVTLDPRSKEFGPNAKYFTFNAAEARKLLSAAYPAGMPEFPSHVVQVVFGPDYLRNVEVADGMAREVGFKPKANPIDYNQYYLPKIVTQRGKFDGWAHRIGAVTSEDPVDFFVWRYYSKAGPTSGALGFDLNGVGDDSGDANVDAMIDKAKAEFDTKKQVVILGELQRYLAEKQYGVNHPGIATFFEPAWPALANYQVFQGDSRTGGPTQGSLYTWWIDDQQAPLKKA